tara:strand:+ start:65 stop:304 length:240 start_codon:yes stop_codon:yes gene_type:complete
MSQISTRLVFQLVAVVLVLITAVAAAMVERHHLVTTAHQAAVKAQIADSNMKDALGATHHKVLLEFTEDQVRVTEIPQV